MKNSMKTPDQKKRSKQLGKEIRDSKKRYEDLRVHGGSDPFWSDGVNMNLCRNHVMYFRKQVETELDPENYPEEYFQEIPAEVSVHYMADAIRRDDLVVMRRCQDPEYYVKYLRESRKKLDEILGSSILEPKLREGQLTIWDFIGGQ